MDDLRRMRVWAAVVYWGLRTEMSTYVVGEAGTSHADPDEFRRVAIATRHVCMAAEAGADAIKFQLFVPGEDLFCPLPGDNKRWDRWRQTFLSFDEWRRLKDLAFKLKIDLLFSAFQHEAVDWCRQLTPRYFKVASRAARDFPYDSVPGPFLVSNGMYTPPNRPGVHVLSCTSQYPCPPVRWNRNTDGLSDHSGTVWPGLDAINRGAKFLEVHFSDQPGGNDPNLTPAQLKLLCDANKGFAGMSDAAA
jgi:sialic acid synthase SpsE